MGFRLFMACFRFFHAELSLMPVFSEKTTIKEKEQSLLLMYVYMFLYY